jgi:predicted nuclease of predicted toxin-antitoxin system
VKFLIDAHLPIELADYLVEQGNTAVHVRSLSMSDASDSFLWEYALLNEYVIVSKDQDFFNRISQDPLGPTIVWLRIGNSTIRELLNWFLGYYPAIISKLEGGEKLVEVL